MHPLLQHAIEVCTDPDCEIHHIEVGLDEEVIKETDLAFFIAGAQAMELAIRREFYSRVPYDGGQEARSAFIRSCLDAGRPILKLAEKYFGTSQR